MRSKMIPSSPASEKNSEDRATAAMLAVGGADCQRCRCPGKMSARVLRENVRWYCAGFLNGQSGWQGLSIIEDKDREGVRTGVRGVH